MVGFLGLMNLELSHAKGAKLKASMPTTTNGM
jgi:hypothetical protein